MTPLLVFAEQWRLHPTFDGDIERIIDTPNFTYLLSNCQPYYPSTFDNAEPALSLFRYNKNEDEIEWLNKQNLLSENILQAAEYNFDSRYLVAIYDNGNIDFIYDNGDVVNVPGLKLANSSYSKTARSICFNTPKKEVFIATGFGYVVINEANGEIKYSRNFNRAFSGIACLEDAVVLVDSNGLYVGRYSDMDFNQFVKKNEYRDVERIIKLSDDKIIVTQIYGWDGEVRSLCYNEDGSWVDTLLFKYYIKSLEANKNGVTVSGFDQIWNIDKDLNTEKIQKEESDKDTKLASWDLKKYFISKWRDGLSVKNLNNNKEWLAEIEGMIPNASNAYKCNEIKYHPDYGLLVRNHGINRIFFSHEVNTPDLLSLLKGLTWHSVSTTYKSPSPMFEQWNPRGIAVDPQKRNHIYSGSTLHGLLRLDIDKPEESLRIGRTNDAGNVGEKFIGVQEPFKEFGMLCPYSAPYFDSYGNLWTVWYDYDLHKKNGGDNSISDVEIYYWTPEDRLASSNSKNFKPLKKIPLKNVKCSNYQKLVAFMSSASKNILMYCSGAWEEYPVFIDHKGTLDNQSDDERVDIKEFTDQDGTTVNFAYIMSVYEDTSAGLVWLGLDNGVINFRPSEIMKTGGRVNRIKVSRNDGTNLADYLLDGVSVNCIVPDNSGRKWFGTGGGGIVVTSADGTEVLRTYTTENSDLPDNMVYSICYNPENNSMMISTDKGLVEHFLSTSAGGDSDNKAVVYPNPVRPDYFGYVTIEGLADNALVKIVDAGGNLIKEVGFAAGGEARWDVTNLNSKRVPGGVYYVLASGAPDGEGFSTVGKVLVVN